MIIIKNSQSCPVSQFESSDCLSDFDFIKIALPIAPQGTRQIHIQSRSAMRRGIQGLHS